MSKKIPRSINIPPCYNRNWHPIKPQKEKSLAEFRKLVENREYQPDLFTWDGILIGLERTLHQLPRPSLPYRHQKISIA